MWRYNSKTIQEGRAWIGEDGIQNSPQWHLWTVEEKEAAGLEEFTPDRPPDSRLYTWSQNADGTIDSMTKALDDALMVSSEGTPVLDEDGNQRVAVGVKSQLISEVYLPAAARAATDWITGAGHVDDLLTVITAGSGRPFETYLHKIRLAWCE